MAEEAVAPAEAPQPTAPEAPAPAAERPSYEGLSDEQIIARASGLEPPKQPRASDGKFAKTPEAAQAQPAAAEQSQQLAAEEKPQEYKWDEVKGIKLKIPMKNGDKQWEEELSLEDLRNQRMMHSDYMARRREIDERAKALETQSREAVEKERTSHLQALEGLNQVFLQVAANELPKSNEEWAKLANEHPDEYVRKANRAREISEGLTRIKAEHEKVQRQQGKEREERQAKTVAEARQKLLEAIPTWNEEQYQSLMQRAVKSYGFKPQEIGQVQDYRIFQLLHDANQYRQLSEGKTAADKKVENTPPAVLKPGAPKPKVNPQEQRVRSAQDRLKRDGNDRDAATALMDTFINR